MDQILPELFILHISHIIIVGIFKCFHDTSAVSFLVLARADESVDNGEDDTDCGCYNLERFSIRVHTSASTIPTVTIHPVVYKGFSSCRKTRGPMKFPEPC